MGSFALGEAQWINRLGSLRNVVRQELIGRQLANHVEDGAEVLDVGCGQGTQAIRLAHRGCIVHGVDPSTALLQRLAADARRDGVRVETHVGYLDDLPTLLGDRTFDLVCAHGLLMYLDDTAASLATMAGRVRHDGALSVTFRNGSALGFRAGMRAQWQTALNALTDRTYVNELGVEATAHTLDEIAEHLTNLGLAVQTWYGVRMFTDAAPADQAPPTEPELRLLLEAEYQASRRDPYRHLASQVHLIARRPS